MRVGKKGVKHHPSAAKMLQMANGTKVYTHRSYHGQSSFPMPTLALPSLARGFHPGNAASANGPARPCKSFCDGRETHAKIPIANQTVDSACVFKVE